MEQTGTTTNCDKVEQVWFALAAGRSVVSRFWDSKYRGTRAKDEAQAVAMDQEKGARERS